MNLAPIPRPHLAGEARWLRTDRVQTLQEEGEGPRDRLGLSRPPRSHQDPSQGALGPPRGGVKLGESQDPSPSDSTPGAGRVGPIVGRCDLGPPPAWSCGPRCAVASHRPGTGHLDRFVRFGAESVPVFRVPRKEARDCEWSWNSCVDGDFCSRQLELPQGEGAHFQVVRSPRRPVRLLGLPLLARTSVPPRA